MYKWQVIYSSIAKKVEIKQEINKQFVYTARVVKPSPLDAIEQIKLINQLAPYYKKAVETGERQDFLEHVYNLWFIRWCMKLEDYEDQGFLKHTMGKMRMAIRKDLFWTAAAIGEVSQTSNVAEEVQVAEQERTWQDYLSICEARAGIAKVDNPPGMRKRKALELPIIATMTTGPGPHPCPCPIKKPRVQPLLAGNEETENEGRKAISSVDFIDHEN
ncbi:hypothetical protein BDZ97DRAFT_1770998 [Flammula alnicola]|nr:hypothetical protein BDZ97DRAFT_1770998 [Flammula alnicola]